MGRAFDVRTALPAALLLAGTSGLFALPIATAALLTALGDPLLILPYLKPAWAAALLSGATATAGLTLLLRRVAAQWKNATVALALFAAAPLFALAASWAVDALAQSRALFLYKAGKYLVYLATPAAAAGAAAVLWGGPSPDLQTRPGASPRPPGLPNSAVRASHLAQPSG